MKGYTSIEDYHKETYSAQMRNGYIATHDIYTQGSGKKVVVIIQELPGISGDTLRLADRFAQRGYTVVLPHLFGPLDRKAIISNMVRVFCMRREFKVFAKGESSPIVDFLSSLCSNLKEKHQVEGVAVIGMCLTGSFALSLMANEDVLAGYASQPSLPLFSGKGIHMSTDDIKTVQQRLDEIGPMYCGRFEKDIICTAAHIEGIKEAFNSDGSERIIFHNLKGKGHSILTRDFVDDEGHQTKQTLDKVMSYFDEQLIPI